MLKVCNIDIERSEEILEKVKEFARFLKKKFKIQKIYLYGSAVRNELHEGSDIDLVIVGNFKGKMPERIRKILKLTDLPIEPLIYTPQEFQKMAKNRNPFIRHVISTGKEI